MENKTMQNKKMQIKLTINFKIALKVTANISKIQTTLREKCPNTELFLVRVCLYSVRIQENTDQE